MTLKWPLEFPKSLHKRQIVVLYVVHHEPSILDKL